LGSERFSWKRQRQEKRKMTQVSRPRMRGQDRLIERGKREVMRQCMVDGGADKQRERRS
jgi:hypothetical protein